MPEMIIIIILLIVIMLFVQYHLILVGRQKKQTKDIEQQMHIMQRLSEIYLSAHIINIREDSFYEINSRSHIRNIVGQSAGNAQATIKAAMEQLASDEHKENVYAFIDFSTLNARMRNCKTISLEFYGNRSGWCRAVFIVVNRNAVENIGDVIFAVQQIDAEKTKELEYQRKLKLSAEEAQRANCAKTEFLSRMSHDIRTPINGIIGMLEILDKSEGDLEKSRECRQKIRISSKHLLSLINDVLDMSKLEGGKTEFVEEPFDLKELLHNCEEIVEPMAEECGIQLVRLESENIRYTHLIGSPLHIRQILVNIISNAIKYNKPNGKVEIHVQQEKCAQGIVSYCFTVEDTGIGMSKEFQQHVFEPFCQEHLDARTTYKGTGLGLAIVKELVEGLHGTITVDSKEGIGSRFEVRLSFAIDDQPLEKEQEDTQKISIAGKRVLVVEDNAFNMEVAQFLLEDLGAVVSKAENGQIAVDMFSENPPETYDVILMDVMMPVMDGLTATREIRKIDRPDARTIPILSMTANAFAEDAKACIEAGMNEHLIKPIDTEKLKYCIHKYCK